MFGLINTAIMWAMAAVALPIMIHLLTRRKLKVMAISTIAFIKRLERENIRRLKIRQLLLLLLRMLIIALLVLAFARPTLRNQNAALAQRARATVAIIIDNSMSMRMTPSGVEQLERGRQDAQEILSTLSTGDEIYLITASHPATILPGSPFIEKEKAAEVVNTISATWAETDIAGAFAQAHELLSESRNVNRELYLLSDGRVGELNPMPEIDGVRGFLIRYDQSHASNLTLTQVSLGNQILEKRKPLEINAVVSNHSSLDQSNQLIHLYLNEKRVAQQTVDLPAESQRSVTFNALPDTTGFIKGRIVLEDDEFIYDNTRYFTFYIPPERRLLAVSEMPDDLLYFRAALNNFNQGSSTPDGKASWQEIRTEELGSKDLDGYDCLLLVNVKRLPEGVAGRISNYVDRGGGLMIVLGSEVDLRHYNESLLARLNLGVFGETIGNLGSVENFVKLGTSDYSHPLFDHVFEKDGDESPNLDSPLFWFAAQFRPAEGTRSILEFANGFPFLVERQAGDGRVLLFTSSTEMAWSDFSFKGIFAPLVHRGIVYLSQSRDNLQSSFMIGDELVTSTREITDDLSLALPNDEVARAQVEIVGQDFQVHFQESSVPGFYELRDQQKIIHTWAVNFDPAELATDASDREQLSAASGVSDLVELPATGSLAAQIEEARYGSELWKLFLIAAIIAMVVEMLLYRSPATNRDANGQMKEPIRPQSQRAEQNLETQ